MITLIRRTFVFKDPVFDGFTKTFKISHTLVNSDFIITEMKRELIEKLEKLRLTNLIDILLNTNYFIPSLEYLKLEKTENDIIELKVNI